MPCGCRHLASRTARGANGLALMGVQAETAGSVARRQDFVTSTEDEPHAARRSAILKAHPEITKLMGYCPRTKSARPRREWECSQMGAFRVVFRSLVLIVLGGVSGSIY